MFIQLSSVLLFLNVSNTIAVDLPEPRMVIKSGQTGEGKSTSANFLIGEAVECDDCTFAVCDDHDSCTFQTVGDVLEENQELKEKIKWLDEIIANNISNLEEMIMRNTDSIAAISATAAKNTKDIITQGENIAVNADNIENNALGLTSNTEKIDVNSEAILTNTNNIAENSEASAKNTLDIEDVRTQLEDAYSIFDSLPLGTIISWTPYPDKNTQNPSDIPKGWMLCDGSEIKEGPWADHLTPDINNSKRFLRGGVVADALNIEEDEVNTDGLTVTDNTFHTYGCPEGTTYVGSTGYGTCSSCDPDSYCQYTQSINGGSTETKPINMNVVFIIKINN